MAREFLRYLQDGRSGHSGDPGFLLDLAHYEWVELALSLDERAPDDTPADPDGDLMASVPVLSPLAWPLSYRWPVHLIRPDFQPAEPPAEPTHLLVYRDRSDAVRFMKLNPVSRYLLELLQQEEELTGLELVEKVARDIRHPDPDSVILAGRDLLRDFREKDIILGTRRESDVRRL